MHLLQSLAELGNLHPRIPNERAVRLRVFGKHRGVVCNDFSRQATVGVEPTNLFARMTKNLGFLDSQRIAKDDVEDELCQLGTRRCMSLQSAWLVREPRRQIRPMVFE